MLFSFPSCIFLIIFIFSCYWKKIKYSAVCEFPNQLFSKIIILFWNKEYYFILMRFLLPFIQCHVYILALDLLIYFDCRLCLNEETSECVILIMLNVRATLLMVTSKTLFAVVARWMTRTVTRKGSHLPSPFLNHFS